MSIAAIMPTILADPELTAKVIVDLSRQTPPPDELIIAIQMENPDEPLNTVVNNAIKTAGEKIVYVRVIISDEFGLSLNRNRALALCSSNVSFLIDDDVFLHADALSKIAAAFAKNPNIDALVYQSTTPNGRLRTRYHNRARVIRKRDAMRVISIEIAIRLEPLRRKNIGFDESFGLGAQFGLGEEILLLTDIIKSGGAVRYEPIKVSIHDPEHTGATLDSKKLIAIGAVVWRVYERLGPLAIIAFILIKVKQGKLPDVPWKCFGIMMQGLQKAKASNSARSAKNH